MASKYIPKIGTKYNDWTVISIDTKLQDKNRSLMFHVRCKCNLEKFVPAQNLVSGKSRSCISCGQFDGICTLSGSYLASIKKGAKSRNIEFLVESNYLYKLLVDQKFKCKLSNIDIKLSKKYFGKNRFEQTASLDRINSSIGYIEGNVQWIHKDINVMKNKFSQDYFVAMCKKIAEACKIPNT